MKKIDLNKPEYFFNRELSWLKFNLRVLKEAAVKTTPLLERLKFVCDHSLQFRRVFYGARGRFVG